MTLIDFLTARLDDEARRITDVPDWHCTDSARGEGWGSRGNCLLCGHYMFDGSEPLTEDAYEQHLEDTHRRSFILADIVSKRLIIREHSPFGVEADGSPDPDSTDRDRLYCSGCGFDGVERMRNLLTECPTLLALALPYADHPDYNPDWRV